MTPQETVLKEISEKLHLTRILNSRNLNGFPVNLLPFIIASHNDNFLIITDLNNSRNIFTTLLSLMPHENVFYFPSSHFRNKRREINVICRNKTILALTLKDRRYVIVATEDGVKEPVSVSASLISQVTGALTLKRGMRIDPVEIIHFLNKYEYREVSMVIEPGTYSWRGAVLDVFSWGYDTPFRVYFDDILISEIAIFDILSQRTEARIEEISIFPDMAAASPKTNLKFLTDFLNHDDHIIIFNNAYENLKNILFNSLKDKKSIIMFNPETLHISNEEELTGFIVPHFTPSFRENLKILKEWSRQGYKGYIFCAGEREANKIIHLYEEVLDEHFPFKTVTGEIMGGWLEKNQKICVIPAWQVLNRNPLLFDFQKYQEKRMSAILKTLELLKEGDYVIHEDYGIAKFLGIKKIKTGDSYTEKITLQFKNNDILYLSPFAVKKIIKYESIDGKVELSDLNSSKWKKQKETWEKKAEEITRTLLETYATRHIEKAPVLTCDPADLHAFSSDFPYIETEDQEKTIEECFKALESEKPADILICGDVGSGKTECALRCSFKTVLAGKQVVILVPTTLLALQHYNLFKSRMEKYGVEVAMLSHLTPPSLEKKILSELKKGKINVVIGTHRLLQDDISIPDIGLLIVDEEYLFGVLQKEKILMMRKNAHCIWMTATPIPRTLNLALNNIKKVCYLNSPIPGRLPVITSIHKFSEELIREAIIYELNRGGQVFFIHNRIEDMEEYVKILRENVPEASIAYAHGRLPPHKIEEIMVKFINREINILVSTAIVEAGLDIPSVNTIIINNAHLFGLNQLHQLRGRVGRSSIQAFCYLLIPHNTPVSQSAIKRLEALEQFYGHGSGLRLSLIDLQMRGPGTLLGTKQSGFVKTIPVELYFRLVEECATRILKEQKIEWLCFSRKAMTHFMILLSSQPF